MNMSSKETPISELMQHPADYFKTPQELTHSSLSVEKKLALLNQWKDEVEHRQTTIAENMLGKDEASLLQAINNEINHLLVGASGARPLEHSS